jgi:predicted lipoprotein with Yx(FWY)xxD motif
VIRIPRPVVPAAVCLTSLALLTACTAGAATTSGGYAAGGGAPMQMQVPGQQAGQQPWPMPAPMTPDSNDPAKSQLRAARPFDLGPMLVDGTGYTVYRYDKDSTTPPRSACVGACTEKWLPVRAAGQPSLIGVDPSLVGKLNRDDGTDQLTLAGWPLYHYLPDEMPGETLGQGVGDAWYPITPDGQKIEATQDTWRANAFRI